jgi:hypothetical protein
MALWRLASRADTVRTVVALRDAGVDCLLLKGVSHELWLYPTEGRPASRDVDLLIEPSQVSAAQTVMERLGMIQHLRPGPPVEGEHLRFLPPPGSGLPVELHTTFHFLTAPPEQCWSVLSADRDWIEVGGIRIEVPAVPARTLLLALHVTAHGRVGTWAIADLRRALAVLSLGDWRKAAELARQLGASDAFAAGLRVLPAGAGTAHDLGLASADDPALRLSVRSGSNRASRMLDYAAGSPLSAAARLLSSQLIPPSAQMRVWYPIARRGRGGLIVAHLARLGRLLTELPRLSADWRQAREAARD